ncbi:glycine cleavage system protein GcvH [Kribbella sandramycini]|uniref:Glycine cleavage system H protein n=1 Tax=Kribbella sandramycini TaxID=60450 RepID=A0A7Y4KX25_9ACTN|nr:glycine cleavage system protein GcvH [Kribbella sandramycini]MBB6569900.1 glycine cleavage system H protein [Kribbella sandramycini]NOL40275.1 glycine cleavage system protein GcvH [Kribbella sandramycini]
MSVPDNLQYTAEHEWIALDGDIATVGITAFAGEALGDVVYVELPAVGDAVRTGDACGEIESTKSVSDLFAPLDGEIVEINDAVVADPGLVNTDPYAAGWLLRLRVTGESALLDAAAYETLIGGE